MQEFEDTLVAIESFCKRHSIAYSVIGGLAAIVHGCPRTTEDVDVTLLVKFESLLSTGQELLKEFVPLKENPLEFFERYFVLPSIHEPTKVKVDFSAGLSEFERMVISHSKKITVGKVVVPVCTVEDLIIYKLIASRHIDFDDVINLYRRHANKIDRKYIQEIAKQFALLERSDVGEKVDALFKGKLDQT